MSSDISYGGSECPQLTHRHIVLNGILFEIRKIVT